MEDNGQITLKNGQLKPVLDGLSYIGRLDLEDFDLVYLIHRNSKALGVPAEAYTKVQASLVKKHVLHEDGQPMTFESSIGVEFKFENGQREKYIEALEKLNAQELESLKLERIPLSSLKAHNEGAKEKKDSKGNAFSGHLITSNMLTLIEPLLEVDIKEPKP